jgi:hypothetical protein
MRTYFLAKGSSLRKSSNEDEEKEEFEGKNGKRSKNFVGFLAKAAFEESNRQREPCCWCLA